jgi:hypothetical protein
MRKIKKLLLLSSITFIVMSILFSMHAQWMTRPAAVLGHYVAQGVWGSSTLVLQSDHSFQQEVKFVNQYTGKSEGAKQIEGHWSYERRTMFKQELRFTPFISPSPLNNQTVYDSFQTSYTLIGISYGIEVDAGANIYYWK